MEFENAQEMIQSGEVAGLILCCLDKDCCRRVWKDLDDLPATLTLTALRRQARCDWCGGVRGFGVNVEVVNLTVTQPSRIEQHMEANAKRAQLIKRFVQTHPTGWSRNRRQWGYWQPSSDLIDLAHVRLGIPMCNLYSQTTPQEAMRQLFEAKDRLGNQPPLPAIFPDMEVPIVRIGDDGERELVRARWGWNKAKFGWVTNVRNLDGWPWKFVIKETAQRCLVPATSFAEYHPTEKTEKGHKAAVWFKLKGDEPRPPFAFAGFYKTWDWEKDGLRKKADQEMADSNTGIIAMAFLTTDANDLVKPIHRKAMPSILLPDQYDAWLSAPSESVISLQRPLPSEVMEIVHVGEKRDP